MIGGAVLFLLVMNLWLVFKIASLESKINIDRMYLMALGANVNTFMNTVLDFVESKRIEEGYGELKHRPATMRDV